MNDVPKRHGTGATLLDVWPAAKKAPRAIGDTSEPTPPHPRTIDGGARASEPVPQARQTATERVIAPRDQRISTETFEGKLLGHGWAHYRFQPTEALSYYARLLTPGGVVNLWGRGLEQAIAQSTTQVRVGDRVAFRRLEQNAQTGRVRWRAEKPEWFAAHDQAAHRQRDEQLAARRAAQERARARPGHAPDEGGRGAGGTTPHRSDAAPEVHCERCGPDQTNVPTGTPRIYTDATSEDERSYAHGCATEAASSRP
jgi:hypothetical protein